MSEENMFSIVFLNKTGRSPAKCDFQCTCTSHFLKSCINATMELGIPSLKLTYHLKMDGWKMSFLLGWPIFRCYVSFREGRSFSQ